jgi:hypothetical protein
MKLSHLGKHAPESREFVQSQRIGAQRMAVVRDEGAPAKPAWWAILQRLLRGADC